MKISKLGVLIILAAANQLMAQNPGSADANSGSLPFLDNSTEALGGFANKATEMAQQFVISKGWSIGEPMADGRFVAIGLGTIEAKPDHPNFQNSRRVAFSSAMLDAKKQIARYYAASISRGIKESYGKPAIVNENEKLSEDPNSLKNKALKLLHAKIDQQLAKVGIALESPEAEKAVEKLVASSTFSDVINATAQAEIGSLVAAKTIEDGSYIAVVAYYSDATKSLQAAMLGKGAAPTAARGVSITTYLDGLSIADLYSTHGVQLRADQNGEIVALSYSQAVAENKSPLAYKIAKEEAELAALGNLRSYAGENIITDAASELYQSAKQLEDLSGAVQQITDTKSSLNSSISAKAEALKFPGIMPAKSWQTVDSRSGKAIYGNVSVWKLSSAINANQERADQARLKGSEGGTGASGTYGASAPVQSIGQTESAPVGFDRTKATGGNSASGVESQDF